jgi:hypothetical protein
VNVGSAPVLRPEDFPEADARMLQVVSAGFRDAFVALQSMPTREVRSGTFTSASSGVTEVSVKNPLSQKPQHVSVSVRREDLADFSAAWSWWYVLNGEQIVLKFIALPASTRHVYSVELS